jgi:hypothetical protein
MCWKQFLGRTPTTTNKEAGATSPKSLASGDELEAIYEFISDKEGLLSQQVLNEWDFIHKFLDEGLLDENEFEDIRDKTNKK